MEATLSTNRRQFLKGSAAVGLVIGLHIPLGMRAGAAAPTEFVPNAFLRIAPDNTVTVISKHIEFGQGPYTGIATILADEIDADWSQVRVVAAPADVEKYANLAFGAQGTGGSTAMANSWDQLRTAGAEARARLIAAAAEAWSVAPETITIERGVVKDGTGRSATLGELAERAQSITLTGPVEPKKPSAWRLIGKGVPRVDTVPKTDGTALFTIDVKLPDMLTCVIARPTRFGAKAATYDPAPALAVPGVKEVVTVPQGVAVLADGFWAAKKGRDALTVTWDEAGTEARSSTDLVNAYREIAKKTGAIARDDGNAEQGLKGAAKVIEATYVFPYLAHARPIFVHKLRGGIDADGNIVAWDQVIVGQSFMKGGPFEKAMLKGGIDHTMVEGASSLPCRIPNLRVSAHIVEAGVPTLWWRSVGSTHTAYSTETFLDQLADAAGIDALAIRRKLLAKDSRDLAVLERAAEAAEWEKPLPKGKARGLAVHKSFNSYVAHVVEVSVGPDGLPKVERVVCAADCGIAINPDVIKAQLEGGMGYGLSAALYGAIDLEGGRVVQSNFDDYRVLRINEMPPIEVHIVNSSEKPTGIGEPGVPTIAPAVANAWAKLTGERLYALPFARSVGKA